MALTDTFVRQVKHNCDTASNKHADGQGMYLLVSAAGKYWRFDYRFNGKRKTAALGKYPEVSLAKARQRRLEMRELLAEGIDPSADKREKMRDSKEKERQTFNAIAREWLEKTKAQRAETTQIKVNDWLTRNLFPYIGTMPISQIKPRDVLLALERMEARGAIESAHRVKQLCGQVFRYAVAVGLAERDVTADLRGALAAIPRTHYAAITEPIEVAKLLRAIHGYKGHPYATAALKLSPLFFVRPGELRSAEWQEIDFAASEWRIPGSKMKMKNDHVVPLATQAIAILKSLHAMTGHGKYVFPSIRTEDRCMSENTVNACLRSMGFGKEVMTAHGFRAMARTILDEVLEERVDLIEHQLAHAVKDANGRAYNRTAHLPARRTMMQRWADYLDSLRLGNS
ncbi:integrase arm-type DNA-binding domain-containing protein [Pseudoduganella sp. FT93W]|uniref:Integrase arm-type DNA-binding domain-containing protein n=1 Tax=Duganella fentianensis TaxID=2692177 RepID=A0A845I1H9_9BURK|nr:integrase arm-type DNA-binding domain-containing protein [Duganella fentianensis]MYN47444.1 integrase arm-type DNA-binding domain-containing protein [Duganella fentianensis]